VDAEFVDWLSQWRWVFANGYVGRWMQHERGRGGRRSFRYLHRVVSGAPDHLEVDHKNRDRTDNRRENLRLVTRAENQQNLPARDGTSLYRGVSWDTSRGKWQAKVRANHIDHHLGRFDDELEAAKAAETARKTLLPLAKGLT
jgi:hypothetical protein